MEETNTNIPLYESLSEDEGDMHDEDQEEPSNPTDPTTAASVKPGTRNKRKGTRHKRSKAWNTFDELPIGEDKVVNVRFSKCGFCHSPDTSFDPTIFRDMITNVVVRHNLALMARDIDILEYWNSNQFRFPNLAIMARDSLSIHISTVVSESAFSIGGRILDQYRSCLAHAVVESLICTRDWRFNEKEILLNYTLEELTQDIIKLLITDDHGPGPSTGPAI
ncbi:hypothetical protein POM88_019878 [Heracleum sosnowskyi]|uniref:HAT C-terminal dimerisation domain-containing protein n=1 Tax=Heracleum sosnowskyi TaxID=360622 RepID=A0AAD8MS86_9APIA|nr:hypothetical protein POM88_019878 [Heracleum sosnowskyi]